MFPRIFMVSLLSTAALYYCTVHEYWHTKYFKLLIWFMVGDLYASGSLHWGLLSRETLRSSVVALCYPERPKSKESAPHSDRSRTTTLVKLYRKKKLN